MCWLGYSIESASDLQGCVWRGRGGGSSTKTLFCFVASNVLANVLTKPSANLCSCFSSLESTCFLSFCLCRSVSLSLQPCIVLHCLTSLLDSQAHHFIQCNSAPHLNNQLSYLGTVSLELTDLRVFVCETKRTVQRDRMMSSLSKCTEVIGQDIRKPANPIQACLLTHTHLFPSFKANSSPLD